MKHACTLTILILSLMLVPATMALAETVAQPADQQNEAQDSQVVEVEQEKPGACRASDSEFDLYSLGGGPLYICRAPGDPWGCLFGCPSGTQCAYVVYPVGEDDCCHTLSTECVTSCDENLTCNYGCP